MIEWSPEGLPLCPECGKFYSPRCKNCFHNRSPEDPLEPRTEDEQKKDEPPQKPEEK